MKQIESINGTKVAELPRSNEREILSSVQEAIDLAIRKEHESYLFYLDATSLVDTDHLKSIFRRLAQEELRHKAKLEAMRYAAILLYEEEDVPFLADTDGVFNPEHEARTEYQKALLVAIHKERFSMQLYFDMAASTADDELHKILLSLALAEAGHKKRLELAYVESGGIERTGDAQTKTNL